MEESSDVEEAVWRMVGGTVELPCRRGTWIELED